MSQQGEDDVATLRENHEDEDAGEATSFEEALRQAKIESITEMLIDISEDPTLLEGFRTQARAPAGESSRKGAGRDLVRTPRKTTPIQPYHLLKESLIPFSMLTSILHILGLWGGFQRSIR